MNREREQLRNALSNEVKGIIMMEVFNLDTQTRDIEVYNAAGFIRVIVKVNHSRAIFKELDMMVYDKNDQFIINISTYKNDTLLLNKDFTNTMEARIFVQEYLKAL